MGKGAFYDCYKLVEVTNKSALKITAGSRDYGYVGYYAKQVITDEADSNIIYKGDYIFYNDNSSYYLLGYKSNATELVLPNDINGNNYAIYQYAFNDCTSLTSVMIGDKVTNIGNYAFDDCNSLTTVYYKGTESDKANISIGYNNSYLTNATWYYYSENEPTTSGNYWRYVDGVPTAW